MNSIIKALSILIISFIGADRINILSDKFDFFVFTPFILFSLIFIFFVFVFFIDELKFDWMLNNGISFNFFATYLLTILISLLFSIDVYISLKRFILLMLILIVFILILSLYNYTTLIDIIIKGALLGSIIFLIFNILLSVNWFSDTELTSVYINLIPDKIAYFVPRLGGYTLDVNRGSVILLFFTYILYNFTNKKYIKFLIVINMLCILISFSRTTYMMLLILFLFNFSSSNKDGKIKIFKYSFFTMLISITLLGYLEFRNLISIELLITERLNILEFGRFTSSGIHLKLIYDGLNHAFGNLKILLFGTGFGTSYQLIEGYYWSGSKYGNYHSMYITSLVECGLFNCVFFIIYSFVLPIYSSYKNIFLGFLIAVFFFNLFYQLNVEPMFWFAILLFYKTNFENQKKI